MLQMWTTGTPPKGLPDNGEGGKKWDSGQRARVIETADDEQTKKGKRNDDAPDAPPAYNPDAFINHLKTLRGDNRGYLLALRQSERREGTQMRVPWPPGILKESG